MLDGLIAEANNGLRQTSKTLEQVEGNKASIRAKMNEWKATCEEIEQRLHRQKPLLEDAVSKQVNCTFVQLQTTESDVLGAAEQESDRMDRMKVQLQAIKDSLSSALDLHDPIKLLCQMSKARTAFDTLDILIDLPGLLPSLDFASGSEIKDQIASMVGRISSRPVVPFQGTFFVLEQFRVNKTSTFVKAILPISNTEAWFLVRSTKNCLDGSTLVKINSGGEVLKRFVFQTCVNSPALFPDTCIAISFPKENKVCCFENEMQMFELACITNPTALAVFENELYACSIASRNYRIICPHDGNMIVILSRQGLVNRVIEFYIGSRIFSYPGRIAVNLNGDIWVSDLQEARVFVETTQGLVVYDAYGRELKRYDTPFVKDIVSFAVGTDCMIWATKTDGRMHILKYY